MESRDRPYPAPLHFGVREGGLSEAVPIGPQAPPANRIPLDMPRRLAFCLVALFSPFPLPLHAASTSSNHPPVNVVLVHGYTDTGRVFRRLQAKLEKQGCRCFAPSLNPKNFRHGVHDLTLKLAPQIDAHFGLSEPFVFVGLSMGGLVARDYLQNFPGGNRVRALFLIATANRGTLWANTSPGGGIRDFAVGSPFLRRLNSDLRAYQHLPVYAYWTPFDLVVVPAINTRCSFGQTRCILSPFHQSMVVNRTVMADIAAYLKALPPPANHRAVCPFANAESGR